MKPQVLSHSPEYYPHVSFAVKGCNIEYYNDIKGLDRVATQMFTNSRDAQAFADKYLFETMNLERFA